MYSTDAAQRPSRYLRRWRHGWPGVAQAMLISGSWSADAAWLDCAAGGELCPPFHRRFRSRTCFHVGTCPGRPAGWRAIDRAAGCAMQLQIRSSRQAFAIQYQSVGVLFQPVEVASVIILEEDDALDVRELDQRLGCDLAPRSDGMFPRGGTWRSAEGLLVGCQPHGMARARQAPCGYRERPLAAAIAPLSQTARRRVGSRS
jgi:hypothetical protein